MLARLSAFLPAIKQANRDLEKKISVEGQKSVDIENLGDDDASTPGDEDEDDAGSSSGPRKPYIEMVSLIPIFVKDRRLSLDCRSLGSRVRRI